MIVQKRKSNDSILRRTTVFIVLASGFWLLLFFRLIQVQIIDRIKYIEQAKRQYIYEAELKSKRGIIYDRKLEPLAVNRKTSSIGVDTRKITNPDSLAELFSHLFGQDKNYYLEKFSGGRPFFWVRRRVEDQFAAYLDSLDIPGVRIIEEARRFYPRGTLAAHVVGFTNIDLKGLSGIELAKDNELTGNNGLALYQKDANGRKIIDVEHPVRKPLKGKNVILTIDNTIQWVAEEELKFAVKKFDADAGVVIIINPKTGGIFALTVYPGFDLNRAGNYEPDIRRNRAITDVHEPGSTFKSIIMAAILEEGIKQPDDIVFCEKGVYHIYDQTVTDVVPYGWLSLKKIIKKSSNIGMAKIAQELDKRIMYKYVRDFGFGLETGIGLPGEASGELKHYIEWSKFTPIAMSIGYEVSVTPIQLVMAYCAIANGGLLLKPQIYLSVADKVNKELPAVKPQVIRRVISDTTAKKMIGMLEKVVYDGTGKRAFIKGLRIAGKTGTALKYDPEAKQYSKNKFISTFIGFFPAESPQMLIYVMIDNPKVDHLAGKVAAPTFKRILQRVLRYIDLQSDGEIIIDTKRSGKKFKVPNLINKRIDLALEIARKQGIELIVENEGDVVESQKLVRVQPNSSEIKLSVRLKKISLKREKFTRVPSVIGLSLGDAIAKMAQNHLKVYVQGSGRVVEQLPKAGEKIRSGGRCIIYCAPKIKIDEFESL